MRTFRLSIVLLELLLVLLGRHLLICEEKEGREGWTEVGTRRRHARWRARIARAGHARALAHLRFSVLDSSAR